IGYRYNYAVGSSVTGGFSMYPSLAPSTKEATDPAQPQPDPVGRRAVLGAIVAGLVAAGVVPLTRPGLGWLLGGVALLGAVALSPRPVRWSPVRIGCALATVLLLGAGTLRASGWLFVLCVLVALPYASLAVAGGGGTWGRLIRGASALPLSVPAAL